MSAQHKATQQQHWGYLITANWTMSKSYCQEKQHLLQVSLVKHEVKFWKWKEVWSFSIFFSRDVRVYFFCNFHWTFPPLLSHDLAELIIPQRYYLVQTYESHFFSKKEVSAYQVLMTAYERLAHLRSVHTFYCFDSSVISAFSQCDEVFDCFKGDNSDETNCHNQTNVSSQLFTVRCPFLYFTSHDGKCHAYNFDTKIQNNSYTKENFTCFNGSVIDMILLEDLVVDCYPKGEDEHNMNQLLKWSTKLHCTHPGQIPCKEEHFRCFKIHEICTYQLNAALKLYPCRTGEHLSECKDIECNMMHKCQGHYCVPWTYMCNGRWDCPYGGDELPVDGCHKFRNCQYFFKCKKTQLCIHLGDVCDRERHCPLNDDEFACLLSDTPCPRNCECLTFAIACSNISSAANLLNQMFVFFVMKLEFDGADFGIWPSFKHLFIVELLHANIECFFCNIWKAQKTMYVDVSQGKIGFLGSTCGSGLNRLIVLILVNDQIKSLSEKSFCNLHSLRLLNLSGNELTHLQHHSFLNVSKIVFALQNNSLPQEEVDISKTLDVEALITDSYILYCMIDTSIIYSSKIPWFIACTGLLHNTSIEISFCVISLIILFLNISSGILQKHAQNRKQQQGNFHHFAIVLNMSDVLLSVPLIALWSVNFYFPSDFILRASNWRSSILCHLVHGLFLFIALMAPHLLCLFSLSRFIVVKFPMHPEFKETSFVKKNLLYLFLYITGLLAIMLYLPSVFSAEVFQSGIPTSLCSPFLDPIGNTIIVKIYTWFVSILIFYHCASLLFATHFCLLQWKNLQKFPKIYLPDNIQWGP